MRNIRKILTLILALILAVSALPCAAADGSEKVLRLATNSGAGDLDPAGIAIDMWTEYCKLCVDPLVRFDADGNMIYEAAESHEVSEDQLVWTFHLRKDAKWSDGSPVVAGDFINTIHRALNPENGMSIYAGVLYSIVGAQEARSGEGSLEDVAVVALDDYTLQMTLKAPCTYFTSLLTVGPFYPSKTGLATLDNPSWWKNPETSLGNGAFCLTEYVDGDHYQVKKNPYYWNADAVNIDTINVRLVYDLQAMLSAYQTGEVDVAIGLPDYIALAYAGSDELFIWNMLTSKFLLPNLNVEVLQDARVREAIAIGINRTEICAVIGSDYIPTTSYVAEFMLSNASSEYFSKEQAPLFVEDVAKAQQLLADAGYPGGKGFPTLTYTYPNSDKESLLAQALQAQLKQNLGITIELNGVEDQVYSSVRAEGSYELIRHSWTADFNDPINYLDLYTSYSGGNYNGVNSPEYDALIEASNRTSDQAERNRLLHQAEQLLVSENFYVIPVTTQVYICLWNPRLTNVAINEKGEPMYRYADLKD
ncbi:MAG: peptide ABC transporter substrate-binding protein [Aristaeellaceae bacterium]